MSRPIALLPKPNPLSQEDTLPEWMRSPYARDLIEAAAYIASGKELKSALLLRDVVRGKQDQGVDRQKLRPVLQVYADSWRRAAYRFASHSGELLDSVRQNMRREFLDEARTAYMHAMDFTNFVRMTYAMARIDMVQGHFLDALDTFEEAFNIAYKQIALDLVEVTPFLKQFGEACQVVFEKYSTRHYPRHLDSGPKAAAYLFLTGDYPDAARYLEVVADRYFEAAKIFHQHGRHTDAFNTLVQAVVFEVVMKGEEVIAQHADQVVQYSILTGDRNSLAVYNRAMALIQHGSSMAGNTAVLAHARFLVTRPEALSALKAFHGVIDMAMGYVVSVVSDVFHNDKFDDTKILKAAWIQMEIVFRQAMAWLRTLESLESLRIATSVSQIGRDGVGVFRYDEAVYLNSLTTAGAFDLSRPGFVRANPHLIRMMNLISPGDPKLDFREIEVYLAQQVECTPAEIAAAFSSYADARIVGKIKGAIGELMFAQLRHMRLLHHYVSLRERWSDPKLRKK